MEEVLGAGIPAQQVPHGGTWHVQVHTPDGVEFSASSVVGGLVPLRPQDHVVITGTPPKPRPVFHSPLPTTVQARTLARLAAGAVLTRVARRFQGRMPRAFVERRCVDGAALAALLARGWLMDVTPDAERACGAAVYRLSFVGHQALTAYLQKHPSPRL